MVQRTLGAMRTLKADISDEAYDGWTRWVDFHGITIASLFEAIGVRLVEQDAMMFQPFHEMPSHIQAVIQQAREVQAKRRRRS